jgi:hypothetical protein
VLGGRGRPGRQRAGGPRHRRPRCAGRGVVSRRHARSRRRTSARPYPSRAVRLVVKTRDGSRLTWRGAAASRSARETLPVRGRPRTSTGTGDYLLGGNGHEASATTALPAAGPVRLLAQQAGSAAGRGHTAPASGRPAKAPSANGQGGATRAGRGGSRAVTQVGERPPRHDIHAHPVAFRRAATERTRQKVRQRVGRTTAGGRRLVWGGGPAGGGGRVVRAGLLAVGSRTGTRAASARRLGVGRWPLRRERASGGADEEARDRGQCAGPSDAPHRARRSRTRSTTSGSA